MDKNEIKEKAKELRKQHLGELVLSDLPALVVSAVPIVGLVLSAPLRLGAYENYIRVMRGEKTGFEHLRSRYETQFESSVIYGIVFTAIAILIFIISRLIGRLFSMILPILGTLVIIMLLAICLPIIHGTECIGFNMLLNNPQMKGGEALNETWKHIKKYFGDYAGLTFSYMGEILLTIVTLGIYGIKFIPELSMAYVIMTETAIQDAHTEMVVETEKGIGLSDIPSL